MISKTTKRVCTTCGKEFDSDYYHGGAIEHENYTNDHNMNVMVRRFKDCKNELYRYTFFRNSITLDGNYESIKDNSFSVGMEIFECRLLWLQKNGHQDIYDYLLSHRDKIREEFNRIKEREIESLQLKIERLRSQFV